MIDVFVNLYIETLSYLLKHRKNIFQHYAIKIFSLKNTLHYPKSGFPKLSQVAPLGAMSSKGPQGPMRS